MNTARFFILLNYRVLFMDSILCFSDGIGIHIWFKPKVFRVQIPGEAPLIYRNDGIGIHTSLRS